MKNLLFNEIYVKENQCKDFLERLEKNEALVKQIEEIQRQRGELLYRFLHFPVADGYAAYQIVKTNQKTVRLEWCPAATGDSYQDIILGEASSFPLLKAKQMLDNKDHFAKMIEDNKKKKEEEEKKAATVSLFCYYYDAERLVIEKAIVDVLDMKNDFYKMKSQEDIPFSSTKNSMINNIFLNRAYPLKTENRHGLNYYSLEDDIEKAELSFLRFYAEKFEKAVDAKREAEKLLQDFHNRTIL